jgi:hypothetical protein
LYGLIAHRACKTNHACAFGRNCVSGWNNNWILTFGAFAFLAGVNLRNTNALAAVLAVELYLLGIIGYKAYTAALGAFYSLARVLVMNTEFLTTVFTVKLNHSGDSQFNVVTRDGESLDFVSITNPN